MRLLELPGTTSFRLALRFLLLFGGASLVLFGFLYWQTRQYMIGRVDNWLGREQAILAQVGRDGLLQRLDAHVIADPLLERPITLFDPAGQWVAGTATSLPPADVAALALDVPIRLGAGQGDREVTFRGMAHRRPSGDLLLVAVDMAPIHRFSRMLLKAFIGGGLATTLLGLMGAALLGANSVRRIDSVTQAIQRIVAGDLSGRLPTHSRNDDLGRLAHVVNGMLDELERLMQEVKGVCDNIAHDLRTPLTRILAGLERIRRRTGSEHDYARAVDEAIVEIRDVLATFAALLRISEVESGARRAGFSNADLSAIVADTIELYEPVAETKGIALLCSTRSDGPVSMRGDPSLLFEAATNLVDNALKFTPNGGTVSVRAFTSGGQTGFEVSDTGPGISSDEAAIVSRRFYRSEASRHTPGNGLGLALVAAVARLHTMELTISHPGRGCTVTLAGAEALPERRGQSEPAAKAGADDRENG